MNVTTALIIVRDNLKVSISDPYIVAGSAARSTDWIYFEEPIQSSKYPIIEITRIDANSEVIDIGPNYMLHEQVPFIIWFSAKNGFKVTVDTVEYVNAQLVGYYLDLIKATIKQQHSTLYAAGVKEIKPVKLTKIEYDPDTQIYYGGVLCNGAFYERYNA